MSEKVILIGLDGATFDLLDPWIEDGKLPNLSKIIKNGVKGELISIFPPATSTGWASICTGVNPGKHGIFDYTIRKKESYDEIVPESYDVDAETVWDILSKNGKKVGIVYVPLTAPPKKVNGFMVPGPTLWDLNMDTFPSALRKDLSKKFGNYLETVKALKYIPGREEMYLNTILYITKKEAEEALYLMKNYEWNFFMVVFFNGDQVQHYFWKYIDASHPMYNQKEAIKWKNAILSYYQEIDNILGKILLNAGEDATVIIVSDHGAGPVLKHVYVNNWLKKIGLLKLKETKNTSLKNCLFKIRNEIDRFLVQFGISSIIFRILECTIIERMRPKFNRVLPPPPIFGLIDVIDWYRTFAYSCGFFGKIFINLKGREQQGIVEKKDYEESKNYIISKLRELRDLDNGENIVDKIFEKEELYKGPHMSEAADILFVTRNMTYKTVETASNINSTTGPAVNSRGGTHRMNGIFIAKGPSIKTNMKLKKISILDITPTILNIMNIPIPSDVDGKVLTEIFEPNPFSPK